MATNLSILQFPSLNVQSPQSRKLSSKTFKSTFPARTDSPRYFRISCSSSSNGRVPDPSDDEGVKSVERLLQEKKRAEIAARIASGEFTSDDETGLLPFLRWGLSKLGVPGEYLEFLSGRSDAREEAPKIPTARGSMSAVRGQAFFLPLYELFLTYGGLFRLVFGPK